MEILINILYILLSFGAAYFISEKITWKSKFMYPLRKKYPFLEKKPWSCTPCLSFWLSLFFINLFQQVLTPISFSIMERVILFISSVVLSYFFFKFIKYHQEGV